MTVAMAISFPVPDRRSYPAFILDRILCHSATDRFCVRLSTVTDQVADVIDPSPQVDLMINNTLPQGALAIGLISRRNFQWENRVNVSNDYESRDSRFLQRFPRSHVGTAEAVRSMAKNG